MIHSAISFTLYCKLHLHHFVSNLLFSFIVYLYYSVHGCAPEREQLKPHQYPSSESQWYDYTHYRNTLEEALTHSCTTIKQACHCILLKNKLLLLHPLVSFVTDAIHSSHSARQS